jgi:hypothetical protein
LVDELCRLNPEFEAMWRDTDVSNTYGEAAKICEASAGRMIALEYSAFAVDGRPDLGMVIHTPATQADAGWIRSLINSKASASKR